MREKSNPRSFSMNALFFIVFCHLCVAGFLYIKGEINELEAYRWAALFIIIGLFPYLIAAERKRFIFYEPVYLFLGAFLFCHTAYMFLSLDDIRLDFEILGHVMKLLAAGAAVFLAGYGFALSKGVARKLPLSNFVIPEYILKRLPSRLYFTGWLMRALPWFAAVSAKIIPGYGYIIARALQKIQGWQLIGIITESSIYAGLMIDAYLYFSRGNSGFRTAKKDKYFLRLCFFFIIELVYAFRVTVMKEQALMPIMLVFIMYFRTRKKIPYIPLLLAVTIFVGVVMPFWNDLRGAEIKDIKFGQQVADVFEKQYLEGGLQDEQKVIIERLSDPLHMSVLTYELRRNDIKIKMYPDMLSYFSSFVPRFLWPNKPVLDQNLLGKRLGIVLDEDNATSVTLTLIGSFIMTGGAYVVVIGMFFTGLILRTYWEWLVIRAEDNAFSFIIYLLLLYPWMRIGTFSLSVHSNISFLIYLYFLIRFLK